MNKLIIFGIVFLMMISIVTAPKETTTTTSTTTTTTSTTTTTLGINPALKYVNSLTPTQLSALKLKVITYIQSKYPICISDVNLKPDTFSFRFKNNYFVALDLTLCSGKHMKYITLYSKLEARVLR